LQRGDEPANSINDDSYGITVDAESLCPVDVGQLIPHLAGLFIADEMHSRRARELILVNLERLPSM
jgi:hypothetical protein